MYNRMLVPLDGSKLAEVVFTSAQELAGRLDIEVILLHISAPELGGFVPMHQAYIEQAADTVRREARKIQKAIGPEAGAKPVRVHGELTVGYPAEEILRYADEHTVDLILMATHGRSGVRRWALGNVADKILRAAKVPVLLVRAGLAEETPPSQWPCRTILVPLDGSKLAESVLPHVEILAKKRSTEPIEVALLKICEPPTMPSYSIPEFPDAPLNWGEYMQRETAKCRELSKQYLAGVEKRLKESKINVHSEVIVGKAADEIVDYANKNPSCLIVMATHGRSGLSRWVYGSVAENVLLGVSSPILLVKPQ